MSKDDTTPCLSRALLPLDISYDSPFDPVLRLMLRCGVAFCCLQLQSPRPFYFLPTTNLAPIQYPRCRYSWGPRFVAPDKRIGSGGDGSSHFAKSPRSAPQRRHSWVMVMVLCWVHKHAHAHTRRKDQREEENNSNICNGRSASD